jgi:hypothetical protein
MAEQYKGHDPSKENLSSINEKYMRHLEAQQEKLKPFIRFQRVNVQRGSGEMEGNWIISGYNDEKNRVVVMKERSPEEIAADYASVMKMVKKEDLVNWNPKKAAQ